MGYALNNIEQDGFRAILGNFAHQIIRTKYFLPMMQKIKNIIFDLGGVLVDLNEQSCIEAFEAIHAPTVGDYVRDHRTEDLFWDIEIGNSTTEEFCHEARRISGTTADNERIICASNQLLPFISYTK